MHEFFWRGRGDQLLPTEGPLIEVLAEARGRGAGLPPMTQREMRYVAAVGFPQGNGLAQELPDLRQELTWARGFGYKVITTCRARFVFIATQSVGKELR